MKTFFLINFPGALRLWERHKQHAPTIALAFGFVWDSLTLGSPDRLFDNAVLLAYILIAGGSIILLNIRLRREKASLPLLILIQFAFGNLASAMFILYGKSGTLEGSALFFLILGVFLVGNEFVKTRYGQMRFHIAAYYFLVFSYLLLVIPTFLGELGERALIAAGTVSVLFIALFMWLISSIIPDAFKGELNKIVFSIATIFIGFNGLYLGNVIPPVPLAMRHLDMYHAVSRADGSYIGTYEKAPWYYLWRDSSPQFHRAPGEYAYCFSSVFAPAKLSAPIYHRWERLNPDTEKWETLSRTSFPIVGGREEGYRGFSVKTVLPEGKWRCSVETERGALIGRRSFTVVPHPGGIELQTTKL